MAPGANGSHTPAAEDLHDVGKYYFAKHNAEFLSIAVVGPGQVYCGTGNPEKYKTVCVTEVQQGFPYIAVRWPHEC